MQATCSSLSAWFFGGGSSRFSLIAASSPGHARQRSLWYATFSGIRRNYRIMSAKNCWILLPRLLPKPETRGRVLSDRVAAMQGKARRRRPGVARLRYVENLGSREIADRLQRPQPSVCHSLTSHSPMATGVHPDGTGSAGAFPEGSFMSDSQSMSAACCLLRRRFATKTLPTMILSS